MADRCGNPEKPIFRETRMVNREYDEIIEEPNKEISSPSNNKPRKNRKGQQ